MKPNKSDVENGSRSVPPSPDYSLDKLKLCSIIGKGVLINCAAEICKTGMNRALCTLSQKISF